MLHSILMYYSVLKVKKIVDLSFSKLTCKVASTYMLPQSSNICLQVICLTKNTWGVKKCKANFRWPSDKANHTCENML